MSIYQIGAVTGKNLYLLLWTSSNTIKNWNADAFQTYLDGSWAQYARELQEQGDSGLYSVSVGTLPPGDYFFTVYERITADPLISDPMLAQEGSTVAAAPVVSSPSTPAPITVTQQLILQKSRELMPPMFSANVPDVVILGYADLVLMEINNFSPLTTFTTESVPTNVLPLLYFGIQVFTAIFLQANATLQDFDYNDNGLSVRVDQVGKINQSLVNLLQMYQNMIVQFKKTQIFAVGGKGLGSPRYQTQIGQFLKIALGSSFNWNS